MLFGLGEHFVENGAQWVHGDVNNSVFHKAKALDLLDYSGLNFLKVFTALLLRNLICKIMLLYLMNLFYCSLNVTPSL